MDMTIYKELKQPSQYHRSFLDGFQYFIEEKFTDALPLFFIAFNESDDNNRNKYLSYYGRTLFHVDDKKEGLKSCLQAAKGETKHSDVFYNLAYVASNANKRELAIKAIAQGRAIDPYDTQLIHLRRALGLRRKPVLGFLSRQNFANVVLGKLSYLVFKQV
jgi:tetratricopeptide (TPR) repeat protein